MQLDNTCSIVRDSLPRIAIVHALPIRRLQQPCTTSVTPLTLIQARCCPAHQQIDHHQAGGTEHGTHEVKTRMRLYRCPRFRWLCHTCSCTVPAWLHKQGPGFALQLSCCCRKAINGSTLARWFTCYDDGCCKVRPASVYLLRIEHAWLKGMCPSLRCTSLQNQAHSKLSM